MVFYQCDAWKKKAAQFKETIRFDWESIVTKFGNQSPVKHKRKIISKETKFHGTLSLSPKSNHNVQRKNATVPSRFRENQNLR